MTGAVEKMRAAWGDTAPEWVVTLAEACAESSQNKVAEQLGRSAPLVSQVLAKRYPGDLADVEARVRGVFMNGTITCPELGEMSSKECRDWRQKARRFGNANMLRVRMYRACNRCTLFQGESHVGS